ncbi:MAG: nitroreductase family protein [Dehalococcoidia bacterium]|nr:nitroreductase family protein [Dehalococcoidia bacterium]MCB9486995.1 nitroreductase family protein [Thermoflexaceae bacterium]
MYTSSREGTDSFFEAIYTQRAIRRFKPDPVPDDLLLRVLEAATKAPSGSNQQPWRFLVVRDAAKRKAMSEALKAHLQSNEAMRTYFESGAQSDDRSKRLMLTGALELAYHIDAAPAVIIPCLTSGSDRLLGGSSIYPAVQNLLLAARALGLGTVLTTFNMGIDGMLRELLGIPEAARPVALIPIGYPDGNFGPTRRKPVEEVVGWDGWD